MPRTLDVVYCDKRPDRALIKTLHPKIVDTQEAFEEAWLHSTSKTLWLSKHMDDFSSFVNKMTRCTWLSPTKHPILLTLGNIREEQSPSIRWPFRRVVEAGNKSFHFLPDEEIAAVIASENAPELVIGGNIDVKGGTLTLVRGDLSMPLLFVPLSTFKRTLNGIKPNFEDFEIIDYGQTIRFGKYEASLASLLYEFDPIFRRRRIKELAASGKTFGASLKRLRIQKNLTQYDFPGISGKEVGRIERGEIKRPHPRTTIQLAKVLKVQPSEIESY
jgi:hypothetical protein